MNAIIDRLRGILTAEPRLTQEKVRECATNWRSRPNADFIDRMKQRSMLHQETLSLLDFFTRRAKLGILEIGPYIGGSTSVVAKALKESGRNIPFVTVEVGGAHHHPQLPSTDILRDLRKNLAMEDILDRVQIVEGLSEAPETVAAVKSKLKSVDLLIIDAEGRVGKDFMYYGPLLSRGAVVVCDDYVSNYGDAPAPEKQELVNPWLDKEVAAGRLIPLGVYPWGTWFGQVA